MRIEIHIISCANGLLVITYYCTRIRIRLHCHVLVLCHSNRMNRFMRVDLHIFREIGRNVGPSQKHLSNLISQADWMATGRNETLINDDIAREFFFFFFNFFSYFLKVFFCLGPFPIWLGREGEKTWCAFNSISNWFDFCFYIFSFTAGTMEAEKTTPKTKD